MVLFLTSINYKAVNYKFVIGFIFDIIDHRHTWLVIKTDTNGFPKNCRQQRILNQMNNFFTVASKAGKF